PPLPYHLSLIEQIPEVMIHGVRGRLLRGHARQPFTWLAHDVYFLHIARSFIPASRAPRIVHGWSTSPRVHTTTINRCCSVGAHTARNVGAVAGTRLSIRNVTGAYRASTTSRAVNPSRRSAAAPSGHWYSSTTAAV